MSAVKLYLFLYDCNSSKGANSKRVSFTKKLYGYKYKWKTTGGYKERRKPGLLDTCKDARRVNDSAILIPEICYQECLDLFNRFQDILEFRIFEVVDEILQ